MKLIRSALDWLGWERLTETRARQNDITKRLDKLMATQAELVQQVQTLTAQLADTNTKLTTTNAIVVKIGTETDGLITKIADLEAAIANQSDASPELVAAFGAAKEQADTLAATAAQVEVSAAAGDAKVTDAPPVENPPVENPPAE